MWYLVHAQRAEGEGLAGVGVDEEDFSVQDHAVAAGEGLGDELLKVGHLQGSGEDGETLGDIRGHQETVGDIRRQ